MIIIQLRNKELVRPKNNEKIIKDGSRYGLWRRYCNEFGEYWNKVDSFNESDILNVFE